MCPVLSSKPLEKSLEQVRDRGQKGLKNNSEWQNFLF